MSPLAFHIDPYVRQVDPKGVQTAGLDVPEFELDPVGGLPDLH